MSPIIAAACIALGVAAVPFAIWFVATWEVPRTTAQAIASSGIAFAAGAAWLGFGQHFIFLMAALGQAAMALVFIVVTMRAWPQGELVRRTGPRFVVTPDPD
jgi:hypothetical protein